MKKPPTSSIWVIIPGLNEQKYIGQVLEKVAKYTQNVIVIDDGSTDNFAKIARKYTPHVISHSVNLGKGAALKTGCEYAFNQLDASAVVFMDSDDQHDPSELSLFIKEFASGHDVVFGVRAFDQNMPLIRIMSNRLVSLLIYLMFGTYVPDIPSGYKGLSRLGYQKVKWNATDYAVELEIAVKVAKYKLNFATIPVKTIYHDLQRGMTPLDTVSIMWQLLIWRLTL